MKNIEVTDLPGSSRIATYPPASNQRSQRSLTGQHEGMPEHQLDVSREESLELYTLHQYCTHRYRQTYIHRENKHKSTNIQTGIISVEQQH